MPESRVGDEKFRFYCFGAGRGEREDMLGAKDKIHITEALVNVTGMSYYEPSIPSQKQATGNFRVFLNELSFVVIG